MNTRLTQHSGDNTMITCHYERAELSDQYFDGIRYFTTIWFDNRFGISLWDEWDSKRYCQFTASQPSELTIIEVSRYLCTH